VRVVPENGASPGHPGLRFSIIDTGVGLKAQDLERIFQPFEQADNSSTRKFQGTGLGLALTRRLIELHGGRIWAESEGEGKGSCFHFFLPLQKDSTA
jgi:signal transduction histidine kinase